MWSVYDVSTGLTKFPRLSLFTYEPSYYSTLLVPLAFYYYLKIIFFKYPNAGYVFFLVSFPLVISFSLGAILGIAISLADTLFFEYPVVFPQKKCCCIFTCHGDSDYGSFLVLYLVIQKSVVFKNQ